MCKYRSVRNIAREKEGRRNDGGGKRGAGLQKKHKEACVGARQTVAWMQRAGQTSRSGRTAGMVRGGDGCDPRRRGSHAIDVEVEFTHGERIFRSSLMREYCASFSRD